MSIFSDGQLQARVQSGAIVGVRRVITFSTDRRSSEGRGLDLTWRTSVKPRRPRRKPRQRNLLRQDRPVEVPRRQAPRQRQVMLRRPRRMLQRNRAQSRRCNPLRRGRLEEVPRRRMPRQPQPMLRRHQQMRRRNRRLRRLRRRRNHRLWRPRRHRNPPPILHPRPHLPNRPHPTLPPGITSISILRAA